MDPDGPVADLGPADWLVQVVTGFRGRVRDLVPSTYVAYARVMPEPPRQVRLLGSVLERHTQTQRCWFALWDGWPAADRWRGAPTFQLPHRAFLLFAGSLCDDPMAFAGDDRGPSLWWPEDRAWVVASEVDSDATYVAGSRALVGDLLGSVGLAATEVVRDDPITCDE